MENEKQHLEEIIYAAKRWISDHGCAAHLNGDCGSCPFREMSHPINEGIYCIADLPRKNKAKNPQRPGSVA